ncbi:MAG: tripartite tricarboxylate transporter substrate binding protein [Deltaproteobacteria bacterium]|nr:tripartite tricarboxylate transporter substrate binding protein [Deltaproteobacteria bacterium]
MKAKAVLVVSSASLGLAVLFLFGASISVYGWEPTRPVEFIIMAGQGGGADKYARLISGLADKHNLAPVPLVPINKVGGAGAVAMQYVQGKKGDDQTIMITLSSFVMTPIAQQLPFNYKDFTPISLLALDNFFLWVHRDIPWKSVADFVKTAKKRSTKVGGTGSKQEDELIFTFFEQRAGLKPVSYVPFKGGGTVAANLVGKHIEASVNNPSEGLPHYPSKLRALATFAESRHTESKEFKNLPTMKELGYNIQYQMMRGIFGPPDMPKAAQKYYAALMKKVYDLKEFQDFLQKNILDAKYLKGDDFAEWVERYNDLHVEVMTKAGWAKAVARLTK